MNTPCESCVCSGLYDCEIYYSPKRKRIVLLVKDVHARTYIEFHPGSFVSDTMGCVLLATKQGYDSQGRRMVGGDGDSRATHERLMALINDGQKIVLKIREV